MGRIRDKNQQKILRAASQVFARKGYAGTKTAEIAELAELPKANIYYYFRNKENLYRNVLESVITPLLEASEPMAQQDSPAEAMEQYIRTKIRISQAYPHASKVFASEIMHGAPHLPRDIADRMMQQTRSLETCLNEWASQGLMDKVDAKHLLFTIWAATQTYADFDWQIMRVTGKDKLEQQDYDTAADLIVKLILNGLSFQSR